MKGMDEGTLSISVLSRHRSKDFALAGEALAAAQHMRGSMDAVRGGPWSLARLDTQCRAEILKVAACSTAADVLALKMKGRVRQHLMDEGFGGRAWEPYPSTPPIFYFSDPRRGHILFF